MFKNYLALVITLLCAISMASAQKKISNKKISLVSISNIGLLNGSKGSSLSLQTILGASIHRSFIGLGVGLDHYRFRSVPLFADLRHEFVKNNRAIFVYGDVGYNYDWLTESNKRDLSFFLPYESKGGIYYDAGLGYRIGFKSNDALLISAGYSYKVMRNHVGTGACPVWGPCFEGIERYKYSMPRLVLKMGWKF